MGRGGQQINNDLAINYLYTPPQQINSLPEVEETHSKILYILEELLDNRALEAYIRDYHSYLFALSTTNKQRLTKKFFTYIQEMMTDLDWATLTIKQEQAMLKLLTNKPPHCLALVIPLFERVQAEY